MTVSPGVGEPGRKIRFADLERDGYADYIIVYDGGAADAYLNRGTIPPTDGDRIWDDRQMIATGVGQPGYKVRFADITGGKRDDYVIQYTGGSADAYNNTNNIHQKSDIIDEDPKIRNWVTLGTISDGVDSQGPVQYADLDGDGRDDYLVVSGNGEIYGYRNSCNWTAPDPGEGNGGGKYGVDGSSTCNEAYGKAIAVSSPSHIPCNFL